MKIRLAPLFDLICTQVYPTLSKKMAMKIGDTYELGERDARQFEKLAEQIGFTKPLVKRKVIDQGKKIIEHLPGIDVTHPVADEIRKLVGGHCKTVLTRFSM